MSNEKKLLTSDFIPCKDAELRWVFIDAPGKPAMDPTKPNRKVCSLYATKAAAQPLIDAIQEYWDENKGKGWNAKSLGFSLEKKLKEGGNPDDESHYNPTGLVIFNFWTGANWPDGKDRIIDIYNSKSAKISLGGKKIGNGSQGAVSFTMAIYENGAGPKANRGVTLYLNAIQLTKFIEYSQSAGFKTQDDKDGFTGVESDTFEGTATEDTAQPRPKL